MPEDQLTLLGGLNGGTPPEAPSSGNTVAAGPEPAVAPQEVADPKQASLFGEEPEWHESIWRGLPECKNEDLAPFHSIYVHFEDREAMEAFAQLVKQRVTPATRFIWHPEAEIEFYANKRWVALSLDPVPPRLRGEPTDPDAT